MDLYLYLMFYLVFNFVNDFIFQIMALNSLGLGSWDLICQVIFHVKFSEDVYTF